MNNVIYSINAGDNLYLPVIEEYLNLNNTAIKNEIIACHKLLIQALENTGVKYQDFRKSLLPADGNNHFEYLFVFRLIPDDNSIYSYIEDNIASLFSKDSRLSISIGDLILYNSNPILASNVIKSMFKILNRPIDDNWCANYFLIYINNITAANVKTIDNFFKDKDFYMGCADVTFSSLFKSYISNHSVLTKYIKIGKNVFNQDADTEPHKHSKIHNGFWSWREEGYNIYGINDVIFTNFLVYKIDTYQGNLYSTYDFRYNKIYITSDENEKFDINDVEIDINKYDYLEKEKNIFKQINVSKEKFIDEIRNKIQRQSYYNIEILDELNVIKFCIFLEFENQNKKIKKTLALKYDTNLKKIFIVSMY